MMILPKVQRIKSPLKWPGGKYSELDILAPFMHCSATKIVDPFFGGGSLPFNTTLDIEGGDVDENLVGFYKIIQDETEFENFVCILDKVQSARQIAHNSSMDSKNFETSFHDILHEVRRQLPTFMRDENITTIANAEIRRRKDFMTKIELEGGTPHEDYCRTGLLAALYYNARTCFNNLTGRGEEALTERVAMWYILRELSHGGLMRYSASGAFNVPYGGISYNSKDLLAKRKNLEYAASRLKGGRVLLRDFRETLNQADKNSLVFLDPPYDTRFSSYSGNAAFSRQQELFDWCDNTEAKFLMVTKMTDAISTMAKGMRKPVKVSHFSKKYSVNIKGRNSRETTHLVISNF